MDTRSFPCTYTHNVAKSKNDKNGYTNIYIYIHLSILWLIIYYCRSN